MDFRKILVSGLKAAANWKLKPGLENVSYFGLIISNNLTGEKNGVSTCSTETILKQV